MHSYEIFFIILIFFFVEICPSLYYTIPRITSQEEYMKINWNKDYTTKAFYTTLVIFICILFSKIIFKLDSFTSKIDDIIGIFQPFIIGGVMAYLLNFILKFYEDNLIKITDKLNKKSYRSISMILTYLTAFLSIYMFTCFVLPQLVDSLKGLANDIPIYVDNASKFLNDLMQKLEINPEVYTIAIDKWNSIVAYIVELATSLLPVIGQFLKTTASGVWNVILGLIISVYLLADKDNFKALYHKITYALFSRKHSEKIIELVHRSNMIFGKFISGKIIDSLIIGALTFVILTIFKMPYTVLISVIIGITNIIPFFGPFFGAIPSAIIILFVSPTKALWFILIIVVIQQIDGNIIGPKILGDSIGISAFWILFSLLIAGKLFGIVGMIIGVPAFAVIYSIIKEIIEAKLAEKGLPTETENYL